MKQRIITGIGLIIFLAICLWLPNWVMALATLVCISFAVWEEYHALTVAEHRVVSWPTWVLMAASIPVVYFFGVKAIVPMLAAALFAMVTQVLFREKPELTDLSMSTLPLLTVALPGLSLVALALIPDQKAVEVVLLCLTYTLTTTLRFSQAKPFRSSTALTSRLWLPEKPSITPGRLACN